MRISILGLGNVLMGDDGLGPYVIEQLRATYRFADNVTIEDLGTPGLDLIPYLQADVVILVDTVKAQAPAGTIRLYRKEDITRHEPSPRMSPHEPGVKNALITLELAGEAPKQMLLVGVVPQDVRFVTGLSAPVQRAVPQAMQIVVAELDALGAPAVARPEPLPADTWWENAASHGAVH